MLQIYNTLTRTKAIFQPIEPGKVNIYVCGITVYDHCHIGHARTYLAFDVVIRYLRFVGYKVNYVRNITDIDDKIIERARANNESVTALTNRFIAAMHADFAALKLLPANHEPKATEYMEQMVALMQNLEANGFAYQAGNGDVYYDVRKFAAYGQLSHRLAEDMQAGVRVEVNMAKRCPLDFVLWKAAKPGEPAWASPWGDGRPGWHLECSAMAMHNLGATFDIHGGGIDLCFPHHENECAQSEAATGKKFVNTWMHAGFLQINQEKMSKSLGNFSTIQEILRDVNPETLRFFMLSGHYRSALEYSPQQVALSKAGLERFYIALRNLKMLGQQVIIQDGGDKLLTALEVAGIIKTKAVKTDTVASVKIIATTRAEEFSLADINVWVAQNIAEAKKYVDRFVAAMDDDFNTVEALAVLFDLVKDINKVSGVLTADNALANQELFNKIFNLGFVLRCLGGVLGILQLEPEVFLHGDVPHAGATIATAMDTANVADGSAGDIAENNLTKESVEIESLIQQRNMARKNNNWLEADRVRAELTAMGIILEDTPGGTIWRRK